MSSIDIKTVIFQRGNIDREPYLLPPKEANTDKIWLLRMKNMANAKLNMLH